jgi:predicted unusual protein kinase regulating ubiquinone biosynthesis (AarF/ABC1/UbiB family)
LSLAIKAGATLEGTIRSLHPDIDIVGIVSPHLETVVARRLSPERVMREMMGDAVGLGSLLRTVPGQLDQLLHDFDTGNVLIRPVTPELDTIPKKIHSLAGTLAIAAFAQAFTVACALTVPDHTTQTAKIVVCAVTGGLALFAWAALFVRHVASGASPLRMTPLLKLFRKQ